MTESELISGCIDNDRRCQNALYVKYYPLMSSIALRYCSSQDEALQGINFGFLNVLKSIGKYDGKYALATWIRNILVNHLIDEFRKNQRYNEKMQISDYQEFESGFDRNLVELKWEEDALRSMLKKLPNVTHKVFNMYAIDGYKHKEISQIMHISVGTSKWHVSEARKRLRALLEEQAEEEKKRIELASLKT